MEPVGSFADGTGSVLAGLGIHLNAKKNRLDTVYFYGASYKKPKKSVAGDMVNLFAGPLSLEDISSAGIKPVVSWSSEVGSVTSSVGKISDVENMTNTVAEETSYMKLDEDDDMNKTTPRKTHTQTYMLGNLLKQPSFNCLSNDNDDEMVLSPYMVLGSNKLPLLKLHAPKKQSFNLLKFFVLNIELLAVPGIIRSLFTSESSMNKAKELAICEKIVVNNILKKVSNHLDKKIVVKEILVNLPKSAIESVFSKFGKIVSIKMQLIGLWQKVLVEFELSEIADLVTARWSIFMGKDSVCVAKAVDDKQSWVSRDLHQALLYTFSVDMTAYDLSDLLESYGERTCFIGHNPSSYVCDRCAIVCFDNEASKLAAIGFVSVFKSMNLQWAGLSLACCTKCKQFGHVSDMCLIGENSGVCKKWVVTDHDRVCLANIYKKKQVSIICLTSFGGKTWAQVADSSFSLSGSSFPLSADLSPGAKSSLGARSSFNSIDPHGVSGLFDYLASVEWSLKLLSDQISDIIRKLSFVDLVPLPSVFHKLSLTVSTSLAPESHSNIVLDSAPESSASSLSLLLLMVLLVSFGVDQIRSFVFWFWFPITFFILMSGLVWKFAMCNVQGINVPAKQVDIVHWHISSGNMVFFITETKLKSSSGLWIKDKYDRVRIFTSGLDVGYLGASVAVVMNNSLTCHIFKVKTVPSQVILVQLLFKSKLSVTVLNLYAGASAGICFEQAFEVNFIIVKAVNTSTFVVLGGDFNECGSGRSASFKFCSSLGLVNLFNGHYLVKAPIWCNLRDVERTVDYIFISGSLSSAVVEHWVGSVSNFFDIDYNAMAVLVGLGGLLNVQLNSLHKQANKDQWKFKIKDVDSIGWSHFRDCSSSKILVIKDRFLITAVDHDLDAIWLLLEEALVSSVDEVFSRQWFSDFQCSKNKWSSKFLRLELLIAKIVKRLKSNNAFGFNHLVKKWSTLNADKALVLRNMVYVDQKMMNILKYLSIVRKKYRKSKIYKSKLVQEASIRTAIGKHMEKFCLDKSSMIRNVLDRPFQKVVLDHLVVDDELVLDPEGVRLNVDRIMESWTRKRVVPSTLPDLWAHQYVPLDYLLSIVGGLPDGKAAGLSGILNKLWKHGVSMIPKPYDWNGILTNTRPIALIEMAKKILSKILLDRISFACSKFGVLHGVINDYLESQVK
ncbi:hypothetical protein G9A89_020144 [Geosiphon pyriformis]|nr:hypothetical protein G9A89_020144 [Geosiphon pyriformis]